MTPYADAGPYHEGFGAPEGAAVQEDDGTYTRPTMLLRFTTTVAGDSWMDYHPPAPAHNAQGVPLIVTCITCNVNPRMPESLRCTFCDYKHSRRLAGARRAVE